MGVVKRESRWVKEVEWAEQAVERGVADEREP